MQNWAIAAISTIFSRRLLRTSLTAKKKPKRLNMKNGRQDMMLRNQNMKLLNQDMK